MSEETTTTETVEETPETAPAGDGTEETKADETTEQKPEAKAEDELPEWASKERTQLRAEAANWRTKFREAEKALSTAKTPEDVDAVRTEFSAKIAELEHQVAVATVARKYELPDELASRLRGNTPEELETDAKSLQSFLAPAAPERLSGGLDPEDGDDSFDPDEMARQARRSRY